MANEKQLYDMLRAPQRNRKDEELKLLKISRILVVIEAYDKITMYLKHNPNQIIKLIVTISRANSLLLRRCLKNSLINAVFTNFIHSYIASICFYIENTNDLRGAVDLKKKMNEYF